MESKRIEKTVKTPLIVMHDGYLGFMGRSIPNNARQLYRPCFAWAEAYAKNPKQLTTVEIFFEYVDTSSIRCIVDLLLQLKADLKERILQVIWHYERYDDDMQELGSYLHNYLKIPFTFEEVEENQEIDLKLKID